MRNHPIILLFCGVPAIISGLIGFALFDSVVTGWMSGGITFAFLMHLLWSKEDSK